MKEKYKYLTKNVLLFALNGFIPKVLSFILIPIYTGILSTEDYGVSDLITTTVQLLVPIFTLDIQDAVIRFALDKDCKQRDVFSVALRIITVGSVIVALGSLIVSFFDIPGVEDTYLLFLVIMYVTTALQNTVSLFCRGIDRVQVVVVSSALHSLITLSANILFLVVFRWGLVRYLIANSIGSVVALIYSFFAAKLYRYITWRVPKELSRAMRAFSFPLIFSVIAWWINNASDRYILSAFSTVAITGVYAIAYKIPNLLSIFQNIFTQAWSISAIKEFDKDDSDGFIGNMYTMMNFGMVAVCSMIMIVNLPVATILYSKEFFVAWHYVPPLLISVVFNAMALFIGSIFTAVKDTKTLSYSTLLGAGVNTVLNLILIPLLEPYGGAAYGAAIATLLGYAMTLVMRHIILRKHIRMRIRWGRDITVYAILAVQMGIAFIGWWSIPGQCVCAAIILLLYRKEIGSAMKTITKKLLKR